MSNYGSKAIKSGIWYTISNFLVRSIGFITTPIFTRLLTKAQFGLYNNYTSWLAVLTILATMNLESTLISARYDFEDRLDEYIISVLAFSTASSLVWCVLLNALYGVLSPWLGLDRIYINCMIMYLIFIPAIHLFQAKERYYFGYKKTVAISMILSISTAALSVLLVMYMKDRLFGRVIGMVIPTVLIGLVLYILLVRRGKRVKTEYWKYALPICLPYIPHLLSLSLLNHMDRVMITKWCGAEDTAVYSLAYTCGAIITMLMTSLNGAYAPWLGHQLADENYSDIRHYSKIYVVGFFLMAVGVMLAGPEILMVLGGKHYAEAKFVITPIAMGCFCQFLYTMFVNVEQFKKKTVGMAVASVTAALVNLVLNALLIPSVGFLAAAYTTLAGYLVLLAIHMYLVYRLRMQKVYDYRFVLIMVCAGLVVTLVITLLYSHNAIRYVFAGCYAVFLVVVFMRYKSAFLENLKRK